jgi:hypothetical protein
MSTAAPGRRVCPRCSANNFDTQAACWKCGAPLTGVAGAAPMAPASPVASPPSAPMGAPASPRPAGAGMPAGMSPLPVAVPDYRPVGAVNDLEPAIAIWSAFALAFFFPYIAVPAGLVFLMLDNRRKADVGKAALLWGIVFSIAHFLIYSWMTAAAVAQMRQMLPPPLGTGLGRIGASQSAPNWNQETQPLQLPGINK